MRRQLFAVVLAVSTALGLTLVTTSPASAHPEIGSRPLVPTSTSAPTQTPPPPGSDALPPPPESEVPGGGATLSGPAAVSYQGSEHLFVRGTNNRIYVNRFDGTSWTGWGEVPGGHATLSAPAAVVSFDTLFLVHRGPDNRIYWDLFDGSTWTSLGEVPGGGATLDAPAATALGGELQVFVRGTDDRIYQNRYNLFTGAWSGWGQIPGGFATPSGPAATVFNNGQQDVLQLAVRGTDDRIYQNQFNPVHGSWSGWAEIPGGGSTPSGPDIAVTDESLQVAVRGTDDQLYVNGFDGVSWTGWRLLPSLAPTADDPALNFFNSSLTVFTRVADNRIFQTLTLDVSVNLDGDGTSATSGTTAATAPVISIRCTPKSSNPIRSPITSPLLIGSGSTSCRFVSGGSGPAVMSALTVNVALWEAATGPDGRSRFWSLVDHKFLPDVAVPAILQTVSKTCRSPAPFNQYVITTLHAAVPPPLFTPRFRTWFTTSQPVTAVC